MKRFLAICVVASISLISISTFSSHHSKWLSKSTATHHTNAHKNYSHHKKDEDPTNITHLLFGIGGSASTWNDRRHYSELWWKPNVTRGFVWLDKQPPKDNDLLSSKSSTPPYKVSEDTSRFKYTSWYGSRSAIRIARIVKETFLLGLPNVRWFVFGDDDTVFFIENLVTVLQKYDHKEMYYIGGNSECVEQDVIHSYTMAYGGGGFAISYPLAAQVSKKLDGCIDRYASLYGSDQKVQACINEIGVPVTKELGFHQMDIRGNPYGLLAAHPIAPLVTLHHFDYMEPIFPGLEGTESVRKLVHAYKHDPGRMLQHTFCYDLSRNWSFSVSWGYTVQLYPSLEKAKSLGTPLQTFVTWRSWSQGPFTFNTRVWNPDPCQRPVTYFLDKVQESGKDRTRTTYKRASNEAQMHCDDEGYQQAMSIDKLEVSAAKFEASLWKNAPRRQCCEIMNGLNHESDRVVKIKAFGFNEVRSAAYQFIDAGSNSS